VVTAREDGPGNPAGVRSAASTARVVRARLLDGLPVPDRVTGHTTSPASATSSTPRRRPSQRLDVHPGDNLWRLTADLLPPDAPLGVVATGWHLLFAANRAVIGPDPDLLQPGQTLRVGHALADLVDAARPPTPSLPAREAGGTP
jgi:hypothetical protein